MKTKTNSMCWLKAAATVILAMCVQALVAQTIWYVGDAASQWAGKPAANVKATVEEAYEAAVTDGDEIWIAEGEYTVPVLAVKDVSIYGSFAGTESSVDDREQVAGGKPWEFVHPTVIKNSGNPVFNKSSGVSTLMINGITFDGEDGNRRAINFSGGSASSENVLSHCIFKNYRMSGDGGALNIRDATTVSYCLITNNAANKGGGGYVEMVTIHDCEVTNNSLLATGTTPTAQSNGSGGGLLFGPAAPGTTGYNLYVAGNSATFGGGVILRENARLFNSIFENNTAEISGGAVAFEDRDSNIICYNLTIVDNHADAADGAGGVVFSTRNDGDRIQTLYNSILWNNTNGANNVVNFGVFITGTGMVLPDFGYNLIDRLTDYPAQFNLTTTGCVAEPNSAAIFGEDWKLKAGSPAINNGTVEVPGVDLFPEFDYAGNLRVIGGLVDMGAYEFDPDSGNSIPGIIVNDPVTSVKYYTLQGVEVLKPENTGIYIVKKVHASQRVETVKELYIRR